MSGCNHVRVGKTYTLKNGQKAKITASDDHYFYGVIYDPYGNRVDAGAWRTDGSAKRAASPIIFTPAIEVGARYRVSNGLLVDIVAKHNQKYIAVIYNKDGSVMQGTMTYDEAGISSGGVGYAVVRKSTSSRFAQRC